MVAAETGQVQPIAYSQESAARALDVDARTIRRWERQGLLKSVMIGGVKRYAREDLLELVKPNKEGSRDGDAHQ